VEEALESADRYLAYLRQHFAEANINEAIERSAYQLVAQPEEMQRVIVDHLSSMWRKYLAPEWQRTRPLLQQALQALEQFNLKGLSFHEAAQLVTGQELPDEKWDAYFKEAKRLILVPHPHTGPYVMKMHNGDGTLVLFFGAHVPKGSQMVAPDLDRAELLVRIDALADDVRLRILRLIAEKGELRSLQIMDEIELSQSAASRQLSQLTAAGYLKERRCEGAKCYSLNPERITDTLVSLANYLRINERSLI
jgi:DNA-binding transcriptional ArsR family regulator